MSEASSSRRLVLASASAHRRKLLEAAGVSFDVVPADIDEGAIKRLLMAKCADAHEIARTLAHEKAKAVGVSLPDAFVVGADQVLACEGQLFDKPGTCPNARMQLERLRGRSHHLHSAVALVQGENVLWQHVENATLAMRAFSDAFLETYLARAGRAILGTVGAYEIEGLGIQLFETISGDTSTIIGLPMLPLLAELRARGIVET
jgi:septum formation protein